MEMNAYISRYRDARQSFYKWRDETETLHRLMLAVVFACLTGLGAYVRVYTPLSPVPFTAQVFFVLLSGAVLGSRWGGASQMIYVLMGAVGVPWFAGGASGLEYVAGATGGYLVGFVLAAFLVGLMVERNARSSLALVPVMVAGVLVIYAVGATWLAVTLGLSAGEAVALGVAPFLLLDVVKSILAAGAARAVTTRV
jgi:biotin transport system substrate-specific component